MKKLYKTINGVLHYQEAWTDDEECTFHWGVVGSEGKLETYLIDGDLLKEPAVDNVLAPAVEEGYREIPPDAHFQIVVQYKTADFMGSAEELEKRHQVEDILNECLGWTGNGHCDGGDIGSYTINVFSWVVDGHVACKTIVGALRDAGLLQGVVIAYRNRDEEYEVLWPPDCSEPFSIFGGS